MALELNSYVEPFVEVTVNTFKEFCGLEVSPSIPTFWIRKKGWNGTFQPLSAFQALSKGL